LTESRRFSGKILSAIVFRAANKWFVSSHVQMETTLIKVGKNQTQTDVIGVDLGVKSLATPSNGETVTDLRLFLKLSR
jgi:putative transposase